MIVFTLLGLSIALTVATWHKLRVVFRMFRIKNKNTSTIPFEALPTVSLCIPARNETHAMTACLESALQSRYPKLEIIVLDDGSRDDTQHLIKAFAHAGVRFVEGKKLPTGWLGKNHALQMLFIESSGSLILFADVDTRFKPDSIDRLVEYLITENVDMVSVLPSRLVASRSSVYLATLRHFWNLVGHTQATPAVASNAWLIKRTAMESLNGFTNTPLDVRPDKAIAREISQHHAYRFVVSTSELGVSYEKKLSSQYETAIRIYYPDFGFIGTLLRVLALLIVLVPYIVLIIALAEMDAATTVVAAASVISLSLLNIWYLGILRSNSSLVVSLCLPYILLREVYLLLASIVNYRRGKITWKGRSVKTVN